MYYQYKIHKILRVDVLPDGVTLHFEGERQWELVKRKNGPLFMCKIGYK
ncbi:hypothetical protein [Tumebacillus flagellatus]|nr:hypothetical protein [Tumebacillus flagellatus]